MQIGGLRRGVTRVNAALLVLVVIAIVIAAWGLVVAILHVPEYVIPGPAAVASELGTHRVLILSNLWETALEAITGFAVGTILAVGLALLFLYVKPLRDGLFPLAIGISTVPLVAVAPVLMLIFGQGFASKVVMAAMISFFPTLVNVEKGLQSVEPGVVDLFHVLNASQRQLLLDVRVFAARPYFFSALRMTSTACVIGAIIAEWVGSERGLGFLIIQATFNFDAAQLWAVMIVSALLATLFYLAIAGVEGLVGSYRVK